jgi:hypothetical protein
MLERPRIDLRVVAAEELDEGMRACLRPAELIADRRGVQRRLPSYFYEIPTWDAALETQLTPNFGLWELIDVDVREPEPVRSFPRYVPCAITVLAQHLQVLRDAVGRVVRIAANGGYRSPAHAYSEFASPHSWAAAANIYRVGEDLLDSESRIQKYVEIARATLPGSWVRRFGTAAGEAFDHVHIDLGYLTVEPHLHRTDEERK